MKRTCPRTATPVGEVVRSGPFGHGTFTLLSLLMDFSEIAGWKDGPYTLICRQTSWLDGSIYMPWCALTLLSWELRKWKPNKSFFRAGKEGETLISFYARQRSVICTLHTRTEIRSRCIWLFFYFVYIMLSVDFLWPSFTPWFFHFNIKELFSAEHKIRCWSPCRFIEHKKEQRQCSAKFLFHAGMLFVLVDMRVNICL